jgi:non-heme chloroperoxidase
MPYCQVSEDVALYYEDVGDGPPIVFVHGFGMSHSVWENQVLELSKSFRCITFDLRGHGASDKPSDGYTIEQNARDVYALIKSLHLNKTIIVGWSLGVAIAIHFAKLYSNVLSKAVLVGGTPCWGRLADFEHGHTQSDIDSWLDEIIQNRPLWTGGFVENLFYNDVDAMTSTWLFSQAMRVPLHAVAKTIEDSRWADLRPYLPAFDCPVLLLHGQHDALDSVEAAQYMQREIQDARLVVFEDSGHAVFLEERAKFNKELRKFIKP